MIGNISRRLLFTFIALITGRGMARAGEQPVAIFHAFDQSFADVERFVCDLGAEGFSHVQISPAQKSNPTSLWWGRYQPIDYAVVDGRGSAADLKRLTQKAHGCGHR
jgi:alpha-amylase